MYTLRGSKQVSLAMHSCCDIIISDNEFKKEWSIVRGVGHQRRCTYQTLSTQCLWYIGRPSGLITGLAHYNYKCLWGRGHGIIIEYLEHIIWH